MEKKRLSKSCRVKATSTRSLEGILSHPSRTPVGMLNSSGICCSSAIRPMNYILKLSASLFIFLAIPSRRTLMPGNHAFPILVRQY